MKIGEIKKFLQRIESCLSALNIKYDVQDDFYYCTKSEKHCVVVPYISTMDFAFPDYKNCFNYVIVSNGDFLGNNADVKFLTIDDFELIVNASRTKPAVVDLVDLYLFNSNLLEMVKNVGSSHKKAADLKAEKTDVTGSEDADVNTSKASTSFEYKVNIESIEKKIGKALTKVNYGYKGDDVFVFASCSKLYENGEKYWYGYHKPSKEQMEATKDGYVALFFKDRPEYLLIPKNFFNKYVNQLNSSKKDDREWWHIHIIFRNDRCLWRVPNIKTVDVTDYLVFDSRNVAEVVKTEEPEKVEKLDSSVVIKITSTNFHTAKAKK